MSWIDEILFPRRCPVCRNIVSPSGEWICKSCRGKASISDRPRCMRCGRDIQLNEQEYCSGCREKTRSFERGIVGYDYSTPWVRDMVVNVKYHNQRQLLDYPCREMAYYYKKTVMKWGCRCIVPVPVHRGRRRIRGFNQAEEIAERFSEIWGIPVEAGILKRVRRTLPQKELGELQRLENLTKAFEAVSDERYVGEKVILADDIFTTGSTAEACARALKNAGVKAVYAACLSAPANR